MSDNVHRSFGMRFLALLNQHSSGDLLQFEHPGPIARQRVDFHIRHIDDDSATATRRAPFQRTDTRSEKGHLRVSCAYGCAQSYLSAILRPDEQ